MTRSERKRLAEVSKALSRGDTARALRLLRLIIPVARSAKAFKASGPSARSIKIGARKAHAEETARIREAVFKRADGICEFCREMGLPLLFPPAEMHHLEGGNGRRREHQSERNCVAICNPCHRSYHASPHGLSEVVKAWAQRHGYPVPRRIGHQPLRARTLNVGAEPQKHLEER